MKLTERITNYFYLSGKIKVMNYLRLRSDNQLIEWGYSPTLLAKGISAWPWREDADNTTIYALKSATAEERKHINELQNFSDLELADLGISRGSIPEMVRHGRPGIDKPESEAA